MRHTWYDTESWENRRVADFRNWTGLTNEGDAQSEDELVELYMEVKSALAREDSRQNLGDCWIDEFGSVEWKRHLLRCVTGE